MSGLISAWLRRPLAGERGDVPGWVLIVMMTTALVIAIWDVARVRLIAIVSSAFDTVCSGLGC